MVALIRAACVAALLSCAHAHAGTVLNHIRQTKTLRCAVIAERDDWNKADQHGDLSVFDTEICRAVAAYLTVTPAIQNFPTEAAGLGALHIGDADLVVGVTPSAAAAARNAVSFGPTIFFDAVAILGSPDGIVCAADGSDAESLFSLSLARPGARGTLFSFQEEGEMESALVTGHCTGLAATISRFGEIRATYGARFRTMSITAARLGLVKLATAYSDADAPFATAVADTMHALIEAEAAGLTQANAQKWRDDGNVVTERLLAGAEGAAALRVVEAVGNYGEIFARTIGPATSMSLPRGENAPWTRGGLLVP